MDSRKTIEPSFRMNEIRLRLDDQTLDILTRLRGVLTESAFVALLLRIADSAAVSAPPCEFITPAPVDPSEIEFPEAQ